MKAPSDVAASESPCIKVCVLDAHDVCVGCGRLLQEIADWSRLSTLERQIVRERAAARLLLREHTLT